LACKLCASKGVVCGSEEKRWGQQRELILQRKREGANEKEPIGPVIEDQTNQNSFEVPRMIGAPEDQKLNPLESVYIHYVWAQMLNSPVTGPGRSLGASYVLNRYGPNLSSKAVKLAVLAFGHRSKNIVDVHDFVVLQYLGRTYQHLRDAIDRDSYFEIAYACYFIIRCHSEVAWDSRDLTELTTHTMGLMTTILRVSLSSGSFNRKEFVVLSCALCDWYMELASFFQMLVEHCGEPGTDRKSIVESSLVLDRLGKSWSKMNVDLCNEPKWLQSIHEATQIIFPLMEVQRCLHYCLFMNVVGDSRVSLSVRLASDSLQHQLIVSHMFLQRHGAFATFPQIRKKSTGRDEALELGHVLYNLLLIGYVVLVAPVTGESINPLFRTHAIDATGTIGQSLQRLGCSGEVLPVTAKGLFILTGQLFDKLHEYQGT